MERALKGGSLEGGGSAARRFLVFQHSTALGTVVHTTPLVAGLRKAFPDCRIVVVASGLARGIYRNDPNVEAVIETPAPTADLRGAVAALRRAKPFGTEPFLTITPMGNERTKVALQSMLGPGWKRAGFTLVPETYWLPIAVDRSLSQIANNLRMVAALGGHIGEIEPRLYFAQKDCERAAALLEEGGREPGQPIAILVTQTSPTQFKGWRAERFREVAEHVHRRYGAKVVFVGTAAEAAAIETLRAPLGFGTINLAGKTSLMELAALMSMARVGVTLDTGTMHVGRAVGLPMAIVAPAWSPPIEWLPVGNERFRILKNLDLPRMEKDYVIDEVSAEEVVAATDALMAAFPEGALGAPAR